MADRQIRPFNPSNRPQTCLYCGAKLRHTVYPETSYKTTVSLCCQAPTAESWGTRDGRWGSHLYCSACTRELVGDADDVETRTHVTPERTSELAGYAGYFCTRDCGYRFGVLAAEKGTRYRRVEPAPTQEENSLADGR